MKKILLLLLGASLLFSFAAYAVDKQPSSGEQRESFYSELRKDFGFSKTDCDAVRKAGFSPYYAFVLLNIAAEAKQPVSKLIQMRNDGDSWGDMCRDYGIDYEKFMDSIDKKVDANSITFPIYTKSEARKDVSSGPKKRGK